MYWRSTLEENIKFQMDRAYKGFSENFDLETFKKQFEVIPNEASHLFDCQTLEVHLVQDNFSEVLGIPDFHPHMVMDLINHIHEDHLPYVMGLFRTIMAYEQLFECGKDSVSLVFKMDNDRMILKTSTPLVMDSNQHVILVVEQHKDVTSLVNQSFTWSFSGPNSEQLEQLVRNMFEKKLPITVQELAILSLIGKGYSSKEAAEVLFVSKHTVDTHRRNILKKLKVNNTCEALKQMIDLGYCLK